MSIITVSIALDCGEIADFYDARAELDDAAFLCLRAREGDDLVAIAEADKRERELFQRLDRTAYLIAERACGQIPRVQWRSRI